jgi:hypothetical protein
MIIIGRGSAIYISKIGEITAASKEDGQMKDSHGII